MADRPVVYLQGPGGRVDFEGLSECYPIPEPVWEDLYTDHQMMAGASAFGQTIVQHFGTAGGIISVRVPYATRAMVEKMYDNRAFNVSSGGMPQVTFSVDGRTYTCEWRSFKATRRLKRRESYSLDFELRIVPEEA